MKLVTCCDCLQTRLNPIIPIHTDDSYYFLLLLINLSNRLTVMFTRSQNKLCGNILKCMIICYGQNYSNALSYRMSPKFLIALSPVVVYLQSAVNNSSIMYVHINYQLVASYTAGCWCLLNCYFGTCRNLQELVTSLLDLPVS